MVGYLPGLQEEGVMGYSIDLRERIVKAYERGEGSYQALGERFSVSPATVVNYVKRYRDTGSVKALPPSGGKPKLKLLEHHWEQVQLWLQEDPALIWPQVADKVQEHFDISITPSQLSRVMKRRAWTRKKTRLATPGSTATTSS